MKLLGIGGVAAVAGVGTLRLWSTPAAHGAEPVPHAPDLSKAGQEEVDTLRNAIDVASQMFSRGLGPAEDVDRLNRTLLQERMRMATSVDERIVALRDALTSAKAQEELASSRFKAGLVSQVAPLEAKAFRLSVEEQLSEGGSK